jgi:hypothetical protein
VKIATLAVGAVLGLHAFSFVSVAGEPASVALVIDASGSMTARLPSGQARIDAAKQAIADLAATFADDLNVSLRAYGHQSHRSKKDCADTELLSGFGAARDRRDEIVKKSAALKAQGYTPITYVLGLAADDLKNQPGRRTIVLVSDGKETCEGDPCILARKLAEADASLTIHTVGFGVDDQTRRQLQCIARAGRGEYRDADDASGLLAGMQQAAQAEPPPTETAQIVVDTSGPGLLKVENGEFHDVINAETGETVATISNADKGTASLPAGIYNVKFGDGLFWKSIEVRAAETTTIRAGVLKVASNQFHAVLDDETRQEVLKYSNDEDGMPVPPGTYAVTLGKAVWGNVRIAEGETVTLNPGVLKIANAESHKVIDADSGEEISTYATGADFLALPPGRFLVMFGQKAWPVTLAAGQEMVLNPGGLSVTPPEFYTVFSDDGSKAATLPTGAKRVLLPPGQYFIKVKGTKTPFTVKEGLFTEIKVN